MDTHNMMLVGADPELFFMQDKANKFISSIGLVGGSKEHPLPIRVDGCAVQEDNVAVEFNIPAAADVDAFIESINFNLEYISGIAKDNGLSLALVPSAVFDKDQLEHPAAREFGCEPDFNCWTRKMNPRPRASNPFLRSAGGHVHVGSAAVGLNPWEMVQAMDLFLGVPSLQYDNDTARRELYGKAGACRIKPYGAEYRTLSNFWIKDKEMMAWVFNQTHKAKDWLLAGNKLDMATGERIQHCINTSDMVEAKDLMAEFGV